MPPRATTTAGDEDQGKKLLQELGQHLRRGKLNLVDIVDDGRNQGAGGVLLEERHRAAQHRAVQLVAQVGDHSEPRVVDQVCPGIKADAFEDRSRDQRNCHNGPGVMEMLRDEALQIDRLLGAGDREQGDVVRLRGSDAARGRTSGRSAAGERRPAGQPAPSAPPSSAGAARRAERTAEADQSPHNWSHSDICFGGTVCLNKMKSFV